MCVLRDWCTPLFTTVQNVRKGKPGRSLLPNPPAYEKRPRITYKEKTGRSHCRRCRGQKNFGEVSTEFVSVRGGR